MSNKRTYTLTEWIESDSLKHLMRVKDSTFNQRCNLVKKHFLPTLGNRLLSEIKPQDILTVMEGLEGRYEQITISSIHSALSGILNVAWKAEHIPFNPCCRVSTKPPYRLVPEIVRCR